MLAKGCRDRVRRRGHAEKAKGFAATNRFDVTDAPDQSRGPVGPRGGGEGWCALSGEVSLRHSDIRSVSVRRRRPALSGGDLRNFTISFLFFSIDREIV